MWLPASTTPSTRYLVPKDPEQICTSSDGNNKTAIAGFAMTESDHHSLSGIDLSKRSSRWNPMTKAMQKAPLKTRLKQKMISTPSPVRKLWLWNRGVPPRMVQAARDARRYAPLAHFPSKTARRASTLSFAPVAACAQASATPSPLPASPSKTFSPARNAKQKKNLLEKMWTQRFVW